MRLVERPYLSEVQFAVIIPNVNIHPKYPRHLTEPVVANMEVSLGDKWAKRFGLMALLNTVIALFWLIPPFLIDANIARTIAAGSVGTWGYLGFIAFCVAGVLGFVAAALGYYLAPRLGSGRINNSLAWLSLGLSEIGVVVASMLLGIAGYLGGTTLLKETAPGSGISYGQAVQDVHKTIAPYTIEPLPWVAIFFGLAALGVFLGVINLFMASRGKAQGTG